MKKQVANGVKYSQFKDHVVKTVAAIRFRQADNVCMFETQTDACLTL